MPHTVFLGLGSNLGNRIKSFNLALNLLRNRGNILETSFLYETKPLYYSEQGSFLNAVLKYQTESAPIELLSFLKQIEKSLGRVPTVAKGPRNIDLDILFFDNLIMEEKDLKIPHPGIIERDFVLEPLMDINSNLIHPKSQKSVKKLFEELQSTPEFNKSNPKRVFALPLAENKELFLNFTERCYSMGIVNVTPNSFSSPKINTKERREIQQLIEDLKEKRKIFDIFDIGGEATNPKAEPISWQEELARVLPIIRAIRNNEELKMIPISLDTRKNAVLEKVLEEIPGSISILNDVSGGYYDPDLLKTVSKHSLPYVLMHNKGDPRQMDSLSIYNDLLGEMKYWFLEKIKQCISLGIPKWNILLDPGFGFGKNNAQNLKIVQCFDEIKSMGFPVLVGFSNKRFVKANFGEDLNIGNSCLTMGLVQKGANIIRIHDKGIVKAINFANKVYKCHEK